MSHKPMVLSYKGWRNCFLFCLGLFLGTAFCMKWLETRFYFQGELFTIIGLEISYPAIRVMEIIYNIDPTVQTLLKAHLYFDFVFMAGAYGGIASMLMMSRYRVKSYALRKILLLLAGLQLVAWACDIRENMYLLDWMASKPDITASMPVYHFIVWVKWGLALTGALLSVPLLLWKRKG